MGIEAWYIVQRHTHGSRMTYAVVKIEGWRAVEMISKAKGRPVQWYRPSPDDAAAIHAFARRCMEQDWTQGDFNDFVRRTGGCKPAASDGEMAL